MSRRSAALENAWRIHQAQMDWTARVDAKASFALGLQTAVLAAIVTNATTTKLLVDLGWWSFPFWLGIALLVAAVIFSALVVRPRLRTRDMRPESPRDHIFFGHVRLLSARELERRLISRDQLPVVVRQIKRMSDIAWKKHQRVQVSIWLGLVGGILVAAGVLASGTVPHESPKPRPTVSGSSAD